MSFLWREFETYLKKIFPIAKRNIKKGSTEKEKKEGTLDGESSFFLNKRGVYEKVMCNRPCGFYKYKNSGKVCFFYGGSLNVV